MLVGEEVSIFTVSKRRRVGEAAGNMLPCPYIYVVCLWCFVVLFCQKGTGTRKHMLCLPLVVHDVCHVPLKDALSYFRPKNVNILLQNQN